MCAMPRKNRAWLELGGGGEGATAAAPSIVSSTASRLGNQRSALSASCGMMLRHWRCSAATGGLIVCGGLLVAATRSFSTGDTTRLADLLPSDLDALQSPAVIIGLGVQLLLFGGWVPREGSNGGWVRAARPPASLQERVHLITPTWKAGGRLDYSWPASSSAPSSTAASLSLFAAASTPRLAVPGVGATVRSVADALEDGVGLRASDFDAPARAALVEMMTWTLPPSANRLELDDSTGAHLTLLVLSFDATPDCASVADCNQPGPSNELLAASAAAFVRARKAHGQPVAVIAQWEVAAAMAALGDASANAVPVGRPGVFENTAQIFEYMRSEMGMCETNRMEGGVTAGGDEAGRPAEPPAGSSRTVLLAHPDHLRRALRIGMTTFAKPAAAHGGSCAPIHLIPAMQPYRLDWPTAARSGSGGRGDELPGAKLDLFAGTPPARVQTSGSVVTATWHDENLGFFPDGEPQRWAHRREIWVAYEFWARAKGVQTRVISNVE